MNLAPRGAVAVALPLPLGQPEAPRGDLPLLQYSATPIGHQRGLPGSVEQLCVESNRVTSAYQLSLPAVVERQAR